ncbi:SDR family oxidoreductase [Streptomyces sp. NPDC050534]|uniref:SDR family oxidoreductase n=1 Tax=Streptomyces sp. NPDC050534 TaxID=3365625 RepID=UPI0037B36633
MTPPSDFPAPAPPGSVDRDAKGSPAERVLTDVLLQDSAVKRLIEPEEVAEAVASLCSPAAFVTGTSLVLDGGWTAH